MIEAATSFKNGAALFDGRRVLFAVLALVVGLFILNTWHGIGMLPDSTRYMQLVSTPYDAPLYAWLLELGLPLGQQGDETAWIVGLALYIANAALVFDLFRQALKDHPALTVLGTLNVVLSPTFLWVNTIAMSEALFFALALLSIRLFVVYVARHDRASLGGSAVALGLAMLARFVAPPLGAAYAWIMLFHNGRRSLRARLFDLAFLFVLSAGIFAAWAGLSKLMVDRSVGRSLWFYGNADAELWRSGLGVFASSFLPQQVPDLIRLPVLGAMLTYVVAVTIIAIRANWRAERLRAEDLLLLVFGTFSLWYALFIVLSIFVEANLQLNSRYLLPLYVGMIFVTTISAAGVRLTASLARVVVVGLAALLAVNGIRSAAQTHEAFQEGVGFRSLAWRTSPVVAAVRGLPPDAIVYTNAADPLNYLTGRWTDWIPSHSERRTGLESETSTFENQLARFRADLEIRGAYVVFVDSVDWRFYLAPEDELVRLAKLKLVRSEPDGRIYRTASGG